jgi:adenosine kinase
MKIVVTGSIAFDYLMSFPGTFTDVLLAEQLEHISLSFLVESLKRHRGGVAPNIAYTLALLGGRPTVMATAGQDFDEYRAWLESKGVDTSAIMQIEDEHCASFFVTTDRKQNQIASFYTGAMAYADQLSFASQFEEVDLTIISPNDPGAMQAYVNECKELNIPYIFDPSQQTVRLSGEELRLGLDGCALLSVNEYEFNLILDKTGLKQDSVAELSGGILITKGADGAWLLVDGVEHHIPVVPPKRIADPTGSGDAFRAGLMRGMQLGLPWEIAGRMGALAATYVLEQMGTMNHSFGVTDYIRRFREHFDDAGVLDQLMN